VRKVGVVILATSSFLSACGGGGSNRDGSTEERSSSSFSCSPVGGGGATVSSSCVNCPRDAASNPGLAIDTDLTTAAGLTMFHQDDIAAQQSQITLRGTAQSGLVFPAGSKAGLAVGLPTGQNVRYSASVATYLGGAQQESRAVVVGHTGATNGELQYFGFDAAQPTTRAFDAVELSISETTPGLERHDYRVFEVCSDGARK